MGLTFPVFMGKGTERILLFSLSLWRERGRAWETLATFPGLVWQVAGPGLGPDPLTRLLRLAAAGTLFWNAH